MIGRITPAGRVTSYPLPRLVHGPHSLTAGPDGSVWVSSLPHQIARITPAGRITVYRVQTTAAPAAMTVALDGTLWFTESGPASDWVCTAP